SLLTWCQGVVKDSRTHPVELEDRGFCFRNADLQETGFYWFDSREQMLAYLSDCWPCDYRADPETVGRDPRLPLKAARYGEYVHRYDAGEMSEEVFLAYLSEAHPAVTVHWIGTLAEMLEGEGAFACQWRADFRGSDDPEDGYPIEPGEVDDCLNAMGWW